jgi:hypothetical protein
MTQVRLRLGACLSLTGRHARFGRQAALGLQAWQAWSGRTDLMVEDDGGDTVRVAAAIRRLHAGCDLVLGPYSTGLARAAAAEASALDTVIWNHGGAGDHVQDGHPGHVVSVLTPARRYAEPWVHRLARRAERAPLWIVHGGGRWSRQVARGAAALAEALGIQVAGRDGALPPSRAVPEAWDLLACGSFEEDVAAVTGARRLARPPRELCAVAAGVREFRSQVDRPDGVQGIAQWFPGAVPEAVHPPIGPTEPEFLRAWSRWTSSPPDYPAAQAAAAAALAVHCATVAGATGRTSLWSAATSLETRTVFGGFRIHPVTGAQMRHETVLVRWTGTEMAPVADSAAVRRGESRRPVGPGQQSDAASCLDNTTYK